MRLIFWGVRGSIPHSLSSVGWVLHFEKMMQNFFDSGFKNKLDISNYLQSLTLPEIGGFGTATTCVQMQGLNSDLIIDGGSGIKSLSDQILKLPQAQRPREFHILLTHFHFDHIMGLPFFLPHFTAGNVIHYYSPHKNMEEVVRSLFKKPIFPVPFQDLSAEIQFHLIPAYETTVINGARVTPYKTDHPDLCYGYKIQVANKTYAHAVDTEAERVTPEQLAADRGLYENVDLLYIDAQYEEKDMKDKKGWGHGSSDRAFQICTHFAIQQVLLAHHDPAFSIEDSLGQKKNTQELYESKYKKSNIGWDYAYEGLVVEV